MIVLADYGAGIQERPFVVALSKIDLLPLEMAPGRRTLFFEPEGPGFVRLTVIDENGASDSVMVRLQ